MNKKNMRLRFASDFAYVRERGSKYPGRLLVLVVAPPRTGLKVGVVCGRKFSTLAVKRNRARRLLWESFRLLSSQINASEIIMIPRFPIRDSKMQQVKAELAKLLAQAGVMAGAVPIGAIR